MSTAAAVAIPIPILMPVPIRRGNSDEDKRRNDEGEDDDVESPPARRTNTEFKRSNSEPKNTEPIHTYVNMEMVMVFIKAW